MGLLESIRDINPMLAHWPEKVHKCPVCTASWSYQHRCGERNLLITCHNRKCCPHD